MKKKLILWQYALTSLLKAVFVLRTTALEKAVDSLLLSLLHNTEVELDDDDEDCVNT